jgi:hypothetical protein
MRIAALAISLLTIVIGLIGFISPESLTTIRRSYFASPGGLYVACAVRLAFGQVMIFSASSSRWPRILRALGSVVCLQGIAAAVFGLERAQAILEWEAMHTTLLRAGALVALFTAGFVAFAVIKGSSADQREIAH